MTQPRDHLFADPCSVCIHLSCHVFEFVPVNDGLADISGDRVETAGANDVDAFGLMERNYYLVWNPRCPLAGNDCIIS